MLKLLCFKHIVTYENSQRTQLNHRTFHNLQSQYINQTHNLWKFVEDTMLQTWMLVKDAIKSYGFLQLAVTTTTNDDGNTEFWNYRQTDFSYFYWLEFIYGPFGSRTFLSGSHKNSGNIGLLKKKPKNWMHFSQFLLLKFLYLKWDGRSGVSMLIN